MVFTTSFRDLEVWQESMTLVEEIYALSKSFPVTSYSPDRATAESSGINPSNIGEGARRKKRRVTLNHYDIALGSKARWRYRIEVAKRLG
jgi:four helix bundle protein